MARIATHKTLRSSTKTRRSYAYDCLERRTMETTGDEQKELDAAFDRLLNRAMGKDEMLKFAIDERDYRDVMGE